MKTRLAFLETAGAAVETHAGKLAVEARHEQRSAWLERGAMLLCGVVVTMGAIALTMVLPDLSAEDRLPFAVFAAMTWATCILWGVVYVSHRRATLFADTGSPAQRVEWMIRRREWNLRAMSWPPSTLWLLAGWATMTVVVFAADEPDARDVVVAAGIPGLLVVAAYFVWWSLRGAPLHRREVETLRSHLGRVAE